MPKSILIHAAAVLLVFAAGVALGLYLEDRSLAASAMNAAAISHNDGFTSDEARTRFEQNVADTKRIRELEEELARHRSEVLAEHVRFLKEHPNSHMVLMFDPNLKISQPAADFLKITPGEKSAVEGHLQQVRDELKNEMAQKVTVTRQSPPLVTYQIPAMPDGAAFSKRMSDLLTADVGADRAAALLQANEWQIKSELYNFGADPMEIQIRPATADEGGSSMPYRIKESGKDWSSEWNFDGTLPPPFQGLIPFEAPPAH